MNQSGNFPTIPRTFILTLLLPPTTLVFLTTFIATDDCNRFFFFFVHSTDVCSFFMDIPVRSGL